MKNDDICFAEGTRDEDKSVLAPSFEEHIEKGNVVERLGLMELGRP